MIVGVDVGGTFTDAVLVSREVGVVSAKVPTTPEDQSVAVMAAVAAVLEESGATAANVVAFAHGMTVATNALLEGRGARTALVTTAGFEDVVELGRQNRADLYRLCATRPAPLVPADRRFGADERTGPDGVIAPLAGVDELTEAVAASAPRAVAVCLLHADRHPAHERALGAALRERLGDDVAISLSHDVVGTFREYERAATTEVDAALTPLLRDYLRALRDRARHAGMPEPRIMQSSGGLAELPLAAAHAALTVLSGPAGGAAAAALIARHASEPNLLCFDMGGTSCDVSVVADGAVRDVAGREVGGRPLALPMVDVHTVGAGGGSIAWRDAGNALRVGPMSAGAVPGPACYGRGGVEATVTDAHVVLGHLEAARPLAGGVVLDADAAHQAVAKLARALDLPVSDCARGIVEVADAEMVRALRVMTVQRGLDPRDFTLLAFGGAGALHAAAIADELGIERVLAPGAGGVLSALGLAAAQRRVHVQRSVLRGGAQLDDALLTSLRGQLAAELPAAPQRIETVAQVRYRGQSHELDVAADDGAAQLREAFASQHEERYGYRDDAEIELVTLRVTGVDDGPAITLAPDDRATAVDGPAVVDLGEATLLVPEGWRAQPSPVGGYVMERAQ
jgi:N-methylhydantoinase A